MQAQAPATDICMNQRRARRLMEKAGVDVLLANSVWNVAYLSGFVQFHWTWDGIQHFMDRNVWRDEAKPLAAFFLDPSRKSFLACNPWVTRFNFIYPDVEVVTNPNSYSEPPHANNFAFFPLDWTVKALRDRGMEGARIGYEETRLPAYYLKLLRERLPRAQFVPVDDLFWRIRAVKTPEEIRRLREAFRIAAQVYRETFAMMKPGVKLRDIARMQMRRMSELGGLWYFEHLWVHTPGEPWDPPPDYELRAGDEGGCDLGCYIKGYGCDFGRTVSVGPPSQWLRDEFDSLKGVYDEMCAVARVGNTPAQLYETIERLKKEKRAGKHSFCVGHGLGLEVHELPAALPSEQEPFEIGSVIQIEVGSVDQPRNTFVFQEDAGVITQTGWQSLTDLPAQIFVTA